MRNPRPRCHATPRRRAAALLAVAALAGCSAGQAARTASRAAGPAPRSIMLGTSEIDPDDLTMGRDETLTFVSTAEQPLRLEFVQPASGQAQHITCRPTTPAAGKGAEAAWETVHVNAEGHVVADIAPGQWKSTCTLAPGNYLYNVSVIGEGRLPSDVRTPNQGTITVK